MVGLFLSGRASVNAFAAAVRADVRVVDVGVDADLPRHPSLIAAKVRAGTRNAVREPAMTEAECAAALQASFLVQPLPSLQVRPTSGTPAQTPALQRSALVQPLPSSQVPSGVQTKLAPTALQNASTQPASGVAQRFWVQAATSHAVPHATMNTLCALTRRTPGFLGAHEESLALIRAMVLEGTAAANASGVAVEAQPILALTQVSVTDHADHEASMLQDVKAGRRTEVDAINGAIVHAAQAAGVAVPVTETLWHLVKLEEAKLSSG